MRRSGIPSRGQLRAWMPSWRPLGRPLNSRCVPQSLLCRDAGTLNVQPLAGKSGNRSPQSCVQAISDQYGVDCHPDPSPSATQGSQIWQLRLLTGGLKGKWRGCGCGWGWGGGGREGGGGEGLGEGEEGGGSEIESEPQAEASRLLCAVDGIERGGGGGAVIVRFEFMKGGSHGGEVRLYATGCTVGSHRGG